MFRIQHDVWEETHFTKCQRKKQLTLYVRGNASHKVWEEKHLTMCERKHILQSVKGNKSHLVWEEILLIKCERKLSSQSVTGNACHNVARKSFAKRELQVSFAEYSLFDRALLQESLLQKRTILLRSLLMVATPYYTKCDMFSLARCELREGNTSGR